VKGLSKEQIEQHKDIERRLGEAWERLENAYGDFTSKVAEAYQEFEPETKAYNEVIVEANDFVEEVSGEIRGYIDERTEKWQESERGQAFEEWSSAWEDALDEVEIEEPEFPEIPEYIIFNEDDYPLKPNVE